jgi:16S rRNA (guanine527-N7)-methyltransferase
MLVWRCKPPAVPFPLSLGTFVKHFSVIEPKAFPLHRIKAKSLTAAASIGTHNSSCFDSFSCRQKKQIRLYVDTLLQWNQVGPYANKNIKVS